MLFMLPSSILPITFKKINGIARYHDLRIMTVEGKPETIL